MYFEIGQLYRLLIRLLFRHTFANFWTRIWPRPLGGVGRRERKDSGSERPEHDVELA
jgi:hypothetical protein